VRDVARTQPKPQHSGEGEHEKKSKTEGRHVRSYWSVTQ
jgi:hypothetical protein